MLIVAIAIPRSRGKTRDIQAEHTFRVPSINQIPQFCREIRPHVDYPSHVLSILFASSETRT